MLQSGLEFSGRSFSVADIDLIRREVARDFSNLSLTDLSRGAGEHGSMGAGKQSRPKSVSHTLLILHRLTCSPALRGGGEIGDT